MYVLEFCAIFQGNFKYLRQYMNATGPNIKFVNVLGMEAGKVVRGGP